MVSQPPPEGPSARDDLRRLARAARLLCAAERETGIVELPIPRAPAPAPAPAEPATGAAGRPSAAPSASVRAAPAASPAPAPAFAPRVRALELGADATAAFGDLPARVAACTRCGLCGTRTQTVFGEGSARARLVFCGEAPGEEEDLSGRPFVGRAGELLTKMIEAGMNLRREEVFILNALKCRPPGNRTPAPDELAACRPHLEEQIAVLRPDVIVALGNPAIHALLGPVGGVTRVRGRVFQAFGCRVVPTYHPAFLLRQPDRKREAWQDLKLVLELLRDGA